ncbi:(2Fe-2S)-binding protein [Microtetraspora fusca]|uniref:Bacterioferritin-associated ferredoxin n=1 Tax=Microtetraspora fusca TaxID=1997 RepID=A0ABW6V0Z8_MICFU|nr:(2Fe-2S)-binding protein [Microtetraspora fusca]
MFVCICRAVTEDEVHDCIAAGAKSARQVRDMTGAGGDCALCVRKVCAMLKRADALVTSA